MAFSVDRRRIIEAAAAIFFLLAICGLENQEVLKIGTGEFPPFISEDPSKSFLTAVVQAVGEEMGVEFQFEFVPWARSPLMALENRLWGVIPYVMTPERSEKFLFSEPLYYADISFFYYRSDGSDFGITYSSLEDLRPYKIGAVRGYFYVKDFLDADLNIVLISHEEQNVRQVQAGRIDLFPINETVGWYLIETLFAPEIAAGFGTLEKPYIQNRPVHLMTSKKYPGNEELLERFNQALKRIKTNGTYQRIVELYRVRVNFLP